jgi:hypothetical protein
MTLMSQIVPKYRMRRQRVTTPLYDCGEAGMLTVRQIASLTGLCKQSVQGRIDRGLTGAQLVAPPLTRSLRVPTYDCGSAGFLTTAQIAKRTGLTHSGATRRVLMGIRGAALLVPKKADRTEQPARGSLLRALRIARAFPDRVPTMSELQRAVPMSRSNAARWQAAMRDLMEGK